MSLTNSVKSIPDFFQFMCYVCDKPLRNHPIDNDFDQCDRDPNEEHVFDYLQYQGYDHMVLPYEDFSGNGAGITDLLDHSEEWAWDDLHAYMTSESEKLDHIVNSWSDQEPDVCTYAIDRWSSNYGMVRYSYGKPNVPKGFRHTLDELATDNRKTAFVEGQDGFSTEKLIDYHITALYAARFFNVYRGRVDGKLRIGNLRFEFSDTTVEAICFHRNCDYRNKPLGKRLSLTVSLDATREEQEDFVLACIRHGNNHGPDWIVNREDFAYIHSTTCDTKHPQFQACNNNHAEVRITSLEPEDAHLALNFLQEHKQYCRSTQCQCDHYESILWDTVYGVSVAVS